jgi:hypothetical protein
MAVSQSRGTEVDGLLLGRVAQTESGPVVSAQGSPCLDRGSPLGEVNSVRGHLSL